MTVKRRSVGVCLLMVVATASAAYAGTEVSGVGTAAPRWKLTDTDGNTWTSESQLGSVVVLEFWATWCPGCQRNMPEVAGLTRKYAGAPVTVIAVNIRENSDAAAYVREAGLDLVLALEGDEVAHEFGVQGTPAAVVVDPNGRIALKVQGAGDGRSQQLRNTIDRLLAAMK